MISPPPRSYHSLVQIPNFLFTSRRPTSSHSAPPCTPGYDRELPRLDEEQELEQFGEFNVSSSKTLSSVASLGSLDSTALLSQTDDDVTRIKLNTAGSLDSLITGKSLREAENMSMTNHDKTYINDDDDGSTQLEVNHHTANKTEANAIQSNNLLKPTYGMASIREQLKPQSTNYLSPLTTGREHEDMRSAVVNLMVLGGTSKRGIESVDRWIDMWKCQIDPGRMVK